MKIIFKNQDKESFVFELYDEKSKQTLTSSDMIFSTHFFEDNRSKEIFDQALASVAVMIEKDRQQTIQSIELNGNVLIGLIAKKLLPSNVELEKKYLNLQSFFSERDQEWISSRISAVCFHLLQFMNKENLFNGQSKLVSLQEDYKTCGEKMYLDALYFCTVEKIDKAESSERTLLLKAKGFQDPDIMNGMIEKWFKKSPSSFINFDSFLERKSIDTLCVIPNNLSRLVSFNKVIETFLKTNYDKKFIDVITNNFEQRLPQKTIRGLCNRIDNARKLFTVDHVGINTKNILLIDDVFGSGATMNMVAKKIKERNPKVNIVGFAILSSYRKGFDILSEI